MSAMDAISRLLKPRSVAVIGASGDPAKTAGRPVAYLLKHAFVGEIYPVNPKLDRVAGLPCYPYLASLPAVPDVGIVLLGAERAHLAVRELAQRGAAAAIVLASGYTETGEEGARRQAQLKDAVLANQQSVITYLGLIRNAEAQMRVQQISVRASATRHDRFRRAPF